MNKDKIAIFLFMIIPKAFLSRLFGFLMRTPLPQWILGPAIEWFCRKFEVKTDEILYPAGGFRSFDEFFTRSLIEGARKIDSDSRAVVSPVDGLISAFGKINDITILQAKGMDYSLKDLVPSGTHSEFIDGDFITLYLSPGDYHNIHAPVSGRVAGYFNIPGKLYTVQEFMVNGLRGLYSLNERVISYIENDHGLSAVCKIGAMNVGRITLTYADVVTNKFFRTRKEIFYNDDTGPRIGKGEKIGSFHLGSTVVLLFPKDAIEFADIKAGGKIRLGEMIAFYK